MLTKVDNLPLEILDLKQWVCFKLGSKVPRNPHTGGNASSVDPATWGDIETACKACERFGFDGIGFVLANGYFGVDLDHCIDDSKFWGEFVDGLKSYSETSVSGKGIHIICRGKLPGKERRKGNVEMYDYGRYFICTGNRCGKYAEIAECTETIKPLHAKYLAKKEESRPSFEFSYAGRTTMSDEQLIETASKSKQGERFDRLFRGNSDGYSSSSEADLALCNILAFWTGCDKQQMDRIFRASGLMRDKWDAKRGAATYGEITIAKAVADCRETYSGDASKPIAVRAMAEQKRYDMTDTGNAERLKDTFGEKIRYSYSRKKWFFWTGKVWQMDEGSEIKRLADVICARIKDEAMMQPDDMTQEQMMKCATKVASSRGKEAMIKECQHLEGITVGANDFDSRPELMNVQNGIVNLRNGELMRHDAGMMMSKIAKCDLDTSGKPPTLWLSFLGDITKGDMELQRFLQKCVGYSISGSTREQCAFFLYGMGNNGKSTFLDVLAKILGDYASNAQPETFMMKRFGESGASSEIARLQGARFIQSEEATAGVQLNEGLLKQLTGGTPVTARHLYCESFDFDPVFKLWMATNHKPVIKGKDLGIWRRIVMIPFEANIPHEKVDKLLKYKLMKEAPQILAWAVEGCVLWQAEGLQRPKRVMDAVAEYRKEMDLLAEFVDQCIEIDYDAKETIHASRLYAIYKSWAESGNEFCFTQSKFSREMKTKFDTKRKSDGLHFVSIKLTEQGKRFASPEKMHLVL